MPDFVTAEELAEKLRLQPSTIRTWARDGLIPVLRLSGKVLRFDPAEVETALRAHAAKGRDEVPHV